MLRILSSPRRLCTGLTRRDFLNVGGTGMLGLGLGDLLAARAGASGAAGFGKAKNCIILFLYGSPSQLETFDMKPEAPVEIRGTMQPVPSSLPGLDVCELLTETAKVMDRTTVVRSVTHPFPIHGVAYAMTGVPVIDPPMELSPRDPGHHPWFGSVVEYVDRQRRGLPRFPQNVALPFPFSSQRADEPQRAGPYGAFLGAANNPVWTEFVGDGTVSITKSRAAGRYSFTGPEPYLGCTRDSHFRIASTNELPDLSLDRLNRRRSLLAQFDERRKHLEQSREGESLSKFQQMAFPLIGTSQVAEALDVRREHDATRDLYGMTLFGQGCLAARRMIEAGTRLATVFWDEYGLAGDAWDTHWDHYPRMKDQLLPGFDKAVSGLILDLERRGLLDETLVAVLSEHGRTPRLNSAPGGGRDHWSRAYSALFAGGGIARGRVVGASDKHASDVAERPVSPKDLLATMYHLLGVDLETRLPDAIGRPHSLLPEGSQVVNEMLA